MEKKRGKTNSRPIKSPTAVTAKRIGISPVRLVKSEAGTQRSIRRSEPRNIVYQCVAKYFAATSRSVMSRRKSRRVRDPRDDFFGVTRLSRSGESERKDPDERRSGELSYRTEDEDYTERAGHINKLVFAGTLATPWSFAYYHRENRRLLKRNRPLVHAANRQRRRHHRRCRRRRRADTATEAQPD